MASSDPTSDYLIALSETGDREQLSTALQQPATVKVALSTESILVDAQTGVRVAELNLKRMVEAAARSGHADTVETLLGFSQQHSVAVSDVVTMDTIGAALNENPLEVLLKFQAVDPDVFSRRLHIGGDLLSASSHGGPNTEDLPRSKYLGLVQHLLDAGFDPNPNAKGASRRRKLEYPLYSACWQASYEIVECFLAHGAVVQGSRAMRSASYNGRIDLLELLLKYGGDVNEAAEEEDIDGPPGTPLHIAVAEGKEDVLRWLLAHGADVTVKNCEGKVAKDVLGEDGDDVILGLLGNAHAV